jgi:hypothetical protein
MSPPANSETGPVREGRPLSGEDLAHGNRLQTEATSRLKETASLSPRFRGITGRSRYRRVGSHPHLSYDPQKHRVLKPGEKDPGPEPARSRRSLCVVFDDGTCAESRL